MKKLKVGVKMDIDLKGTDDPKMVYNKIGDLIYRLLSPGYTLTYRDFASTETARLHPPKNWQGFMSIEMIHNKMHVRFHSPNMA